LVNGAVEVVAADPNETRMATTNEAAFRAAFGIPDAATLESASPPPARADERSRPGELWPWVLVALLLVLAVENVLATRVQPRPAPSTS
jgi:hypothetical protein